MNLITAYCLTADAAAAGTEAGFAAYAVPVVLGTITFILKKVLKNK